MDAGKLLLFAKPTQLHTSINGSILRNRLKDIVVSNSLMIASLACTAASSVILYASSNELQTAFFECLNVVMASKFDVMCAFFPRSMRYYFYQEDSQEISIGTYVHFLKTDLE